MKPTYKFRKPRQGRPSASKPVLRDTSGPKYTIGPMPTPYRLILFEPIPDEPDAPTLRLAGVLLELIASRR